MKHLNLERGTSWEFLPLVLKRAVKGSFLAIINPYRQSLFLQGDWILASRFY